MAYIHITNQDTSESEIQEFNAVKNNIIEALGDFSIDLTERDTVKTRELVKVDSEDRYEQVNTIVDIPKVKAPFVFRQHIDFDYKGSIRNNEPACSHEVDDRGAQLEIRNFSYFSCRSSSAVTMEDFYTNNPVFALQKITTEGDVMPELKDVLFHYLDQNGHAVLSDDYGAFMQQADRGSSGRGDEQRFWVRPSSYINPFPPARGDNPCLSPYRLLRKSGTR